MHKYDSAKARKAWTAFLSAAVERYGPGGDFWTENAPGVVQYKPAIPKPVPIRDWQIWNEANFFYFAYPVSPQRYARLLRISSPAIKRIDPGAKVILTGLFGRPTAGGARGMPAAQFAASHCCCKISTPVTARAPRSANRSSSHPGRPRASRRQLRESRRSALRLQRPRGRQRYG